MIPKTQRDEMIDMANQITELMDVIKPFAEAAHGVDWEFTKDFYKFYPMNSYGVSITMGNLRKAMEVYEKYNWLNLNLDEEANNGASD